MWSAPIRNQVGFGQKAIYKKQFAWAIFNNKECEMKLITSKKELKNKEENINPKKTSGFNIITDEILKQLSKKAIVKLTYLINTTYRLNYVWIVSEVILIPKPGKPPNEVSSYRSNLFSSCNFETIWKNIKYFWRD